METEYSSERLRKLIEFNRTEPEILRKLIEHASRRSRELENVVKKQKELGERILDAIGDKLIVAIDRKGNPYIEVLGVDGSNQVVGGRSGKYYIMLSAVIVYLPQGTATVNPVIRYPDITIVSFTDPSGEIIEDVAEDVMMLLETRAIMESVKLKQSEGTTPLFIDGPVMDPPRNIREESLTVFKQLAGIELGNVNEYYKIRANTILEAYREGIVPLGYVKRPGTDKLLLNYVGREIKETLKVFGGDEELVRTLLAIKILVNGNNKIYYTTPIEYPLDHSLYELYRRYGLRVYYSYSMINPYSRPFRIEVAVDKDTPKDRVEELIEWAVKLSHALTLPGQRYPLPVVIAHEKCRIRRGAAELIYEEILARTVKPSQDKILNALKITLVSEEE